MATKDLAERLRHDLKVWAQFYDALADGRKTFEVRRDDRGFQVGDSLRLREWHNGYTGRECERRITYILSGEAAETFGLKPGFVALGLSEVESGSEGVTDEDAIERGAAALFKHAELSSQDDGSFAYAALGEIGKERYRKAVRSVVEAAIGSRLASAAKAEARVSELERIFAELRVEAESWEKRDNVFYDRVTEILDESEFSDARALLHASSERAEEGGK